MSILLIVFVVVIALFLIGTPIILERRSRRKKTEMVEVYSQGPVSDGGIYESIYRSC